MHDATSGGEPARYLSSHLTGIREGLGYTRSGYAAKSWATYGAVMPADRHAAILEVGPGGCELAELLVTERGYQQVTIIDREPEVVEMAASIGVEAVRCDDLVEGLAGTGRRFDVIIMLHVLEHMTKASVIPVLRAVRAALADGGVALVEVPNMGDPFSGLHARYADFTHEVGFTEESLRYVLDQAGFTGVQFLDPVGATGRLGRPLQRAARRVVHLGLRVISLPNGRQMRRRIDPVLAVCARP